MREDGEGEMKGLGPLSLIGVDRPNRRNEGVWPQSRPGV